MATVAMAAASTELATRPDVQDINKAPISFSWNPATRLDGVWDRTACVAVTTLGYSLPLPLFLALLSRHPCPGMAMTRHRRRRSPRSAPCLGPGQRVRRPYESVGVGAGLQWLSRSGARRRVCLLGDPSVIGRRIEITADLHRIRVFCDGRIVVDHGPSGDAVARPSAAVRANEAHHLVLADRAKEQELTGEASNPLAP